MSIAATAQAMILIVEDCEGIRRPLARLLRHQGYETLCVANGHEALETLQFTRPSLILLDLAMPVMSGLEFLKVLRQDPGLSDVPVIVVSARAPEDDVVLEAGRLGARACFTKAGYALDDLFLSIRRHVAA